VEIPLVEDYMSIYTRTETLIEDVNQCLIDFFTETTLSDCCKYSYISESEEPKKSFVEKIKTFFVRLGQLIQKGVKALVNAISKNRSKLKDNPEAMLGTVMAYNTSKRKIIDYKSIFAKLRSLAQYTSKAKSEILDENDKSYINNTILDVNAELEAESLDITNKAKKEVVMDLHNNATVLASLSSKLGDIVKTYKIDESAKPEQYRETGTTVSKVANLLISVSLKFSTKSVLVSNM
jgi:hypothetical protein